MQTKIISLGLILSYPVFVILHPVWTDSVLAQYEGMFYANPGLAGLSGVPLVPTLLFVAACIGAGILLAEMWWALWRSTIDVVAFVGRGVSRLRLPSFLSGTPKVGEQHDLVTLDPDATPRASVVASYTKEARCEFIRHRIEDVIARAVVGEATGMHFTIRTDVALLEHVAYGSRREVDKMPPEVAREIVGAMFELDTCASSDIHIDDVKAPMEMSTVYTLGDRRVHVHGFLVCVHPEGTLHATLDLRYAALSGIPILEDLGYSTQQLDVLRLSLGNNAGLTLFSGPSGCGASTSLASMVRQLPRDEATYTIENPVSYDIPGVSQTDISWLSGTKRLSEMSRTILNASPRNIMLYEIDKPESAVIVADGVRSGARVFSYIQADSALGALNRLLAYGIDKEILAEPGFLSSVVYQRLVPVLCPHCSVPAIGGNITALDSRRHGLSERVVAAFCGDLDGIRYRGLGCPFCKGNGAIHRTVVAEVIQPDDEIRALIRAGKIGNMEWYLHAQGWKPMHAHAMQKIKMGQVCPADAEVFALGTLVDEQNVLARAS